MPRTSISIFAALVAQSVLGAPAAMAHVTFDVPPAAEAPLQRHEWTEVFPVTPPISQWVRFDTPSSDGSMFLRKGGIRRLNTQSEGYEVDVLSYIASDDDTAGYYRELLNVSCGSPIIYFITAIAKVIVTPDGQIRPVSDVTNWHGYQTLENRESPIGQICFNPTFRAELVMEN